VSSWTLGIVSIDVYAFVSIFEEEIKTKKLKRKLKNYRKHMARVL
jgi:hypothetical protein